MTREEIAIKVATEIWGVDPEFVARFKQQHIHEVNSWQGFGRTVEAMDAKDWWFAKDMEGVRFYRYKGMSRIQTMGRDAGLTKEHLWKSTHLAALEAIK